MVMLGQTMQIWQIWGHHTYFFTLHKDEHTLSAWRELRELWLQDFLTTLLSEETVDRKRFFLKRTAPYTCNPGDTILNYFALNQVFDA